MLIVLILILNPGHSELDSESHGVFGKWDTRHSELDSESHGVFGKSDAESSSAWPPSVAWPPKPSHSELDSESHERIEFLELFYEALNFYSLFQDKE